MTCATLVKRSRLPSASRWCTARAETTRSNGPAGSGSSRRAKREVGAGQPLARAGEHRLARVDARPGGRRVEGEDAQRRLARCRCRARGRSSGVEPAGRGGDGVLELLRSPGSRRHHLGEIGVRIPVASRPCADLSPGYGGSVSRVRVRLPTRDRPRGRAAVHVRDPGRGGEGRDRRGALRQRAAARRRHRGRRRGARGRQDVGDRARRRDAAAGA